MNFDDIINQVTLDDLISTKSDDFRFNIASFARFIAKGHPGWDFLSQETRLNFQHEIEKVYHNADTLSTTDELAKTLETILLKTIPDGHLALLRKDKSFSLSKNEIAQIPDKVINPFEETSVGNNLAFLSDEELDQKGIQVLERKKLGDNKIISIFQKGHTGILALSSCSNTSKEMNLKWLSFYHRFLTHHKNWDSLIIDVRQNQGGDGEFIKQIAQTLFQDNVPYCQTESIRNTPEAKLLQHQALYNEPIEEKRSEYYDLLEQAIQSQSMIQNNIILNDYRSINYQPPKINIPIYILIDRQTKSAAEALISFLEHHPKTKLIGENSGGVCQYGYSVLIPLPNGLNLKIGTRFRTYAKGDVETKGHTPDIITTGKDAFEVALTSLSKNLSFFLGKNKFESTK